MMMMVNWCGQDVMLLGDQWVDEICAPGVGLRFVLYALLKQCVALKEQADKCWTEMMYILGTYVVFVFVFLFLHLYLRLYLHSHLHWTQSSAVASNEGQLVS